MPLYHLGRLLVYGALGLAAGWLGGAADLAGRAVGLQNVAGWVMGILLVFMGIRLWLQERGASGEAAVPGFLRRLWGPVLKGSGPAASFSMGLLTGLLPCGWLYSFVAVAAGTGDPGKGAVTMLFFWAGSVPALLGLTAAVGFLRGRVRVLVPKMMAVILVLAGAASLAMRVGGLHRHEETGGESGGSAHSHHQGNSHHP